MQKLSVKLKNTPMDAPQVHCSVNSELNKEEILSVQDIVLADNNPDGDQAQHTERSIKPKVYVLNCEGQPVMPCSYAKSKRMVKAGKAKVVKRSPFTIQLNFECENKVQKIILGIDTGYKNIGFSAVSEKEELISGEVTLENGMSKRLQDRAMYRKSRRNRLWYRKPRWKNRVSSKKKGWLPPSIERRFNTHLKVIEQIKSILPISKVIVEVAKFDIQKLENPDIKGKEYQQGDMYEYRNRIAYLIAREKGKCQYCKQGYTKGNSWRLHHIWGRLKNRPKDWALVHESCHKKLHAKNEEHILQKKKSKSYKESIFMSIIRKRLVTMFDCTYGNITFQNRVDLCLEKSHVNDAFVIAGGTDQERCQQFKIEQKRKNNRCLQKNRKGYKPSIRRQRYKYRPKDIIWINNIIYKVVSIISYGRCIHVLDSHNNKKIFATKKIEKHFMTKTLVWNLY